MTTVPNMAVADADRRVRTLDSASRNVAKGAMRRSGTAHGSALTGSNVKPVLVPDAAPDAADTISSNAPCARPAPAWAMRFSEWPPGRRFRGRARPARAR